MKQSLTCIISDIFQSILFYLTLFFFLMLVETHQVYFMMCQWITTRNVSITRLRHKDAQSLLPPFSYLLADTDYHLGSSSFGFDSTRWFLPNTLWIQISILIEMIRSLPNQTFEAVPTTLKTKKTIGTKPFSSVGWKYSALYLSRKEKIMMSLHLSESHWISNISELLLKNLIKVMAKWN